MTEETPQERELDEATRGAAWEEFDKEEAREVLDTRAFARRRWWRLIQAGPLALSLFPRLRRSSADPDPTDERGLRDALHERRPEE